MDKIIQEYTVDGKLTVSVKKIAQLAGVKHTRVWLRTRRLGIECKKRWNRSRYVRPDYAEYVDITCPKPEGCGEQHKRSRGYIRDLLEANKLPYCSGCRDKMARQRLRAAAEKHILNNPPKRIMVLWTMTRTLERAEIKVSKLIVEVWAEWPIAFGLKDFEDTYPDSNRIVMELVKLVREELIYRPTPTVYQITDKGAGLLERFGNVPEAVRKRLPAAPEVVG